MWRSILRVADLPGSGHWPAQVKQKSSEAPAAADPKAISDDLLPPEGFNPPDYRRRSYTYNATRADRTGGSANS